jgi:hypothetical protein
MANSQGKVQKASVHIPLEVIALFKEEVARLYRSGHDLDLGKISNISIAEHALRHFFTLSTEERDKAFIPLISERNFELNEGVSSVA